MTLPDNFYKSILDNYCDGIYITDRERKILFWNKAAEKISGYASEKVLHSSCMDNILVHVDDNGLLLCRTLCPLAKTIQDGQYREANVYLHHIDGHRVPVSVQITPVYSENGEIIGAVESFRDQTTQLAAFASIAELKKAALIDSLTGVGNRRFTETSLEQYLLVFHEKSIPFGVIFCDLDHFKEINDNHGHMIGDRVLVMVARTLTNNLKIYDFVGRWGGDELVLILDNINVEMLTRVANKIRRLVGSAYLVVEKEIIQATVSMGATLAVEGDDIHSLLTRADQALYQSKASGRNCVTVL